MYNRYSDFEELRPTGEASHIPDTRLDDGCEDNLRRQRIATSTGGYPDTPTAIDGECGSCRTSIPAGQTKCRLCLMNHLDTASDDQDTPDSECDLLHVIHALVESRTFYGAVAKGSTAASLLAKSESDPRVDDCQLIYDLDKEPAAQFADQWPALPSAARITSECGEQLLAAACKRTTWTDTTQSRHDDDHEAFLYDEAGNEDRLVALREDTDDDVWLVPAIVLQRSIIDASTGSPRHTSPNRDYLECRECDRETKHRFNGFDDVPDEEWTGQPMWEC